MLWRQLAKPWRRLLLLLGTLLVLDQVLLYGVMRDGELRGQRLAPYGVPLFSRTQDQLAANLVDEWGTDPEGWSRRSLFDAELGWCPRPGMRRGIETYDSLGRRRAASPWPRQGGDGRTLALVGCSFTLGSEVGDEETWAYRLDAGDDDLHVANFGVPGYGLDQALLRYSRDVEPLDPGEVWFGFFPGAALRSLSHFPPLTNRWRSRSVFCKPRFVLQEDGALQLVASPAPTPAALVELLSEPGKLQAAIGGTDHWMRRARPAYLAPGSHWLHYTALGRIGLTIHDKRGHGVIAELGDPGSAVFSLNLALIKELKRRVEASGARFRVVILPAGWELEQARGGEAGYWQPFVDRLLESGVAVFDPVPGMLAAGVDSSPGNWMPEGHHSPAVHVVLEGLLRELL